MKMTVIPCVTGALRTVTKDLVPTLEDLEIRGPSKLQNCWDRPEYYEESWRLEETCCHSDSSERILPNAGLENSPKVK